MRFWIFSAYVGLNCHDNYASSMIKKKKKTLMHQVYGRFISIFLYPPPSYFFEQAQCLTNMNPDILDYSGFTCWLSLMMVSAVVVNAWQATMNADESLNLVPSLSSLISYCIHFKVFTARTHESIYLGNVIQFYIEAKWTDMSFSASHGKVGKTNFL